MKSISKLGTAALFSALMGRMSGAAMLEPYMSDVAESPNNRQGAKPGFLNQRQRRKLWRQAPHMRRKQSKRA